ncbi:replicative DNA helicase [Clostridium beijerinckii]|uniref:Replicative DNA helicase n=1 Tax=Clostridium beijerinckii TaxID=1520 RepID=A0AAE5H6S6_CLOBE|nr:replicative DNA helicase [Clostridium beijerinckii]NSB15861.1 replicative DNA helicase [Clostridium beijerinckii]OOM27984.1 replicative DNA helicase [Clostridium beijerinckii]
MDTEQLQILPQNIRAEQELLSGIFYNPKIMVQAVNELKTNDFYRSSHQLIFNAMCALFADGKEIGITPIIEVLGKDSLVYVGGVSYLTELMTGGFKLNVKQYVDIIKDKSFRRKAIKALNSAMNALYDDKIKPDVSISKMSNELIQTEDKSQILNDTQLLNATISKIEERYANGGDIPGMKTGFHDFDRATNGMNKGDLFVIGARPSMGKTVTALNIADGLAKNGNNVLVFEMEMVETALGNRRLAFNSNVEAQKLKTGKLNAEEFERILMAANKLSKRNGIFTDCSSYQNTLTIKAKTKAVKQTHGLDVVIVDHLTLMDIPNTGNRSSDIGEVTRQLKMMAKELEVTVIVLSQLSRKVEERADKRPTLADLRESGNIEQDADLIMFLYRDEYYNKETEDRNIIEWIIAKQRDGAVGTLKFYYLDKLQRIANIDCLR